MNISTHHRLKGFRLYQAGGARKPPPYGEMRSTTNRCDDNNMCDAGHKCYNVNVLPHEKANHCLPILNFPFCYEDADCNGGTCEKKDCDKNSGQEEIRRRCFRSVGYCDNASAELTQKLLTEAEMMAEQEQPPAVAEQESVQQEQELVNKPSLIVSNEPPAANEPAASTNLVRAETRAETKAETKSVSKDMMTTIIDFFGSVEVLIVVVVAVVLFILLMIAFAIILSRRR